jgi:hypothetical protein
MQCCGTGTAGTANFCLGGTESVMYSGSGLGSGSNKNWNTKVKKLKNKKLGEFLGNMLILKRQDFLQIF